MEQESPIIKLIITLLILLLTVAWYGNRKGYNARFDFTEKVELKDREAEKASETFNFNYNPQKRYWKERDLVVLKTRSLIPFVYNRDTLMVTNYKFMSEPYNR